MKQEQELVVITKTDDLILWTCNHTNRFPRNQRFVLGEKVGRNKALRSSGIGAQSAGTAGLVPAYST